MYGMFVILYFNKNHLRLNSKKSLLKSVIPFITDSSDMSHGCSQGYKPKTGPKQNQKENIPKQRKYKCFTSLKL